MRVVAASTKNIPKNSILFDDLACISGRWDCKLAQVCAPANCKNNPIRKPCLGEHVKLGITRARNCTMENTSMTLEDYPSNDSVAKPLLVCRPRVWPWSPTRTPRSNTTQAAQAT